MPLVESGVPGATYPIGHTDPCVSLTVNRQPMDLINYWIFCHIIRNWQGRSSMNNGPNMRLIVRATIRADRVIWARLNRTYRLEWDKALSIACRYN